MSKIFVSDAASLNAAASSAVAGDTILLAAGTYSGVSISNALKSGTVNIQSADTAHQAILTDLKVNGSSGFNFSNLEFSATVGTELTIPFKVLNSQNIHFDHLNVHGTLDGDPTTDMSGFSISGSSNVSVTNSEFQQLKNGIQNGLNDGVLFSGNYFHDIRSDGIDNTGSNNVVISNNYFTNFRHVTGDHSDAIQFFTTNRTASVHDITVTDNVITQGNGAVMQGVFVSDEVGTLPYINVKISQNAILGGNWNGIYNNHAQNLEISDNMLVSLPGQQTVWVRVSNVDGGTINSDAAITYAIDNTTLTNVTQFGNALNAAASDGGMAALHDWLLAHPGNQAPLPADLLTKLGLSSDSTTTTTTTTPATTTTITPPEPDSVSSSVSYTLGSASHSLTLTGTANIDGTGNDNGDAITGNTSSNHLTGGAGNDTISDGGAGGADTMAGNGGDDTYYVKNTGDVVTENTGGGADTVSSSVTFALGANVENLVLTGAANIDGTGNALGNHLTGNAGANHLYGGAANDWIDGGAGADTMSGGAGNDTYSVDSSSDSVIEKAGQGDDLIQSLVSYALGTNVESLLLVGSAAIDGSGNANANRLTGNGAANRLTGDAGADSIDGGGGNDVITGAADNDTLKGGTGNDIFKFNVRSGHDVITDFDANGDADQIDISAYTSHRYTPTIVDHGTYTTVSFSTGDSIDLLNVHASDLHLSHGMLL